jgi:L-rhamnonate dehydratase
MYFHPPKSGAVTPQRGQPVIREVRALVSNADEYGASDVHDTPNTHWISGCPDIDGNWDHEASHPPIANPMSIYPEYAKSRQSWGVANVPSVIVEIEDEDGRVGIGASTGGAAAAFLIERHLALFVEGQCAANRSLIWEQMWRASIHYGRKGLGIHAISAIDIALWDLYGRTVRAPVFDLMGGRTKEKVPVYATTSRPDIARDLGFHGAKFPLPYGPGHGITGMTDNIAFIADWRAKVGPDFPLMLDCYMSMTTDYAAELSRRLEPYDLQWIEEPLMPDDYDGHKRLAMKMNTRAGGTVLATGEHEYTRFGYQQLVDAGVELIQPDVMWMGGPTEFLRVAALASSQSVDVIPHGCGVYGYYMAMAIEHIPMAEFMMMNERADGIEPNFGTMFQSEPLPKEGYISLPDTPGFGLELNRDALNLSRPFDRSN